MASVAVNVVVTVDGFFKTGASVLAYDVDAVF